MAYIYVLPTSSRPDLKNCGSEVPVDQTVALHLPSAYSILFFFLGLGFLAVLVEKLIVPSYLRSNLKLKWMVGLGGLYGNYGI